MQFEYLIELFKKYKKLILITSGLFILLIILILTFTKVDNWLNQRRINKLNNEINSIQNNIEAGENNLFNLNIDNRLKTDEVNKLTNDYNSSKSQTDDARNKTNQSLENINKLNNKNFNNSNLTEAERNRCIAYNRGC